MAGFTREDRKGARDGSDRVARIARWLHIQPRSKNIERLQLTLDDGDVLGSWDRADVLGAEDALAFTIDCILLDAANDQGTTVTARLAWMIGDTSWSSKVFRAFCEAQNAETIKPLDGSLQSMLQQCQRHNEAFAQQIATANARSEERVERVLGIYERIMGKVLERLDDAETRREMAEAREHQALELAEQAAGAAESAKADVEAAAAAKDDTLGKVIEIGVKQLMQGGPK